MIRLSQGDDVQLVTSVLAETPTSPIRTMGLSGILTVRCVLHDERSHLAVMSHPHHALTDEAGEAVLVGVPALPIELTAWRADHQAGSATIDLEPDEREEVTLTLTPRQTTQPPAAK